MTRISKDKRSCAKFTVSKNATCRVSHFFLYAVKLKFRSYYWWYIYPVRQRAWRVSEPNIKNLVLYQITSDRLSQLASNRYSTCVLFATLSTFWLVCFVDCTELAAEIFTEVKNGQTLERLDVEEASRISRNACVSPCSLVLALLYLERLKDCNPEYLQRVAPSELFLVSLVFIDSALYTVFTKQMVHFKLCCVFL